MNGQNLSVIRDVEAWLGAGQSVWLCTILETWGSSPRPAGSWLAVNADGQWSGSVSGGCLEEDLIGRCRGGGISAPMELDYGVTDDDREHFQLPCGGRIHLLVEPLTPDPHLSHASALRQALDQRQAVTRQVSLTTGICTTAANTMAPKATVSVVDEQVYHNLAPRCRVLLVGAGEVARYVVEFGTAADFDMALCEPREAFAGGWRHPTVALQQALPDDLVSRDYGDAFSAVLALAHDPRVDDMALLAALGQDSFYIGAMGSERTSASRRERLASLGLSEQQLARLNAPIGVNIPSKTPAEIAISIVADLIRARHRLLAGSGDL